jgi:hypothetical protein
MRTADPAPGEPYPDRPIMFVHVPRTGGSTVKRMLQLVFGTQRSLLDLHRYDAERAELGRYALLEGHLLTSYFRRAFGSDWYTNGFVMLRDPVTRVVSQARHMRALRRHRDHAALAKPVVDPGPVFDRVAMLSNLQTKQLAGKLARSRSVDTNDLETAKALLDRMAFGLTEVFDESMCLLAERFALDLPQFGVEGASPPTGDDDLRSEDFRAEAERRNPLDLALYRYAQSLLVTRRERYAEAVLHPDYEDGLVEVFLTTPAGRVKDAIITHAPTASTELRGWMTIGGEAPDAVLVRTSAGVTPLCCRIESGPAVRETHRFGARSAGVQGRVALRGCDVVEIVAVDRTRGLRGQVSFPVRILDRA